MPKAASSASAHASSASPFDQSSSIPIILKRNQACHQCRRRKLKCDAKRPCGTCIRSHKNALNHAVAGVGVPPLDCTFDDSGADQGNPNTHHVSKNRYERLETRINELEAMLRQKEQAGDSPSTNASTPPQAHSLQFAKGSSSTSLLSGSAVPSSHSPTFMTSGTNGDTTSGKPASMSNLSFMDDFDLHMGPSAPLETSQGNGGISPFLSAHITQIPTPPSNGIDSNGSSPESTLFNQLFWPKWPDNLPPPELLRHLVDAFFAFHPLANRLFHAPSFLASLSLSPDHSNFPQTSILHAISAVGSVYTAAVPQAPRPNFEEVPADEIFQGRHRRRIAQPDSFGEKHARLARETIEECTSMGEYLLESVQANILIIWFYHTQARWVDVFMLCGRALRACVPLGLNMCPPFHSISKSLRAPSILPPARTVIEDETRRTTFWLAYAMERCHTTGNGWAMGLDDQDISQLLPVRGDQFEQGILIPPNERQWAHSADLLTSHPPEQTDSFILYIKAAILLSKVKNFNLRFRAKNFAGDSSMLPPQDSTSFQENGSPVDPRKTKGFQEIDCLVSAFADSFPRGFKNPITENIVDSHLFTACLAPHVATMLLHDPHASVKHSGCISAQRILSAARALLNYLYAICSTSYDITLLDNFCPFAWFMAGRVLVRFLQAAKDADDQPQLITFGTELEFIRIALGSIGERIPLAYRYAKMLDDIVQKSVGVMESIALSHALMPRSSSISRNPQEAFLHDTAQDSLDTLLGGTGNARLIVPDAPGLV